MSTTKNPRDIKLEVLKSRGLDVPSRVTQKQLMKGYLEGYVLVPQKPKRNTKAFFKIKNLYLSKNREEKKEFEKWFFNKQYYKKNGANKHISIDDYLDVAEQAAQVSKTGKKSIIILPSSLYEGTMARNEQEKNLASYHGLFNKSIFSEYLEDLLERINKKQPSTAETLRNNPIVKNFLKGKNDYATLQLLKILKTTPGDIAIRLGTKKVPVPKNKIGYGFKTLNGNYFTVSFAKLYEAMKNIEKRAFELNFSAPNAKNIKLYAPKGVQVYIHDKINNSKHVSFFNWLPFTMPDFYERAARIYFNNTSLDRRFRGDLHQKTKKGLMIATKYDVYAYHALAIKFSEIEEEKQTGSSVKYKWGENPFLMFNEKTLRLGDAASNALVVSSIKGNNLNFSAVNELLFSKLLNAAVVRYGARKLVINNRAKRIVQPQGYSASNFFKN